METFQQNQNKFLFNSIISHIKKLLWILINMSGIAMLYIVSLGSHASAQSCYEQIDSTNWGSTAQLWCRLSEPSQSECYNTVCQGYDSTIGNPSRSCDIQDLGECCYQWHTVYPAYVPAVMSGSVVLSGGYQPPPYYVCDTYGTQYKWVEDRSSTCWDYLSPPSIYIYSPNHQGIWWVSKNYFQANNTDPFDSSSFTVSAPGGNQVQGLTQLSFSAWNKWGNQYNSTIVPSISYNYSQIKAYLSFSNGLDVLQDWVNWIFVGAYSVWKTPNGQTCTTYASTQQRVVKIDSSPASASVQDSNGSSSDGLNWKNTDIAATIWARDDAGSLTTSLEQLPWSNVVNGVCWTANGKRYNYTDTVWGAYSFCTQWTTTPTSPAFPAQWSSTSWSCVGIDGWVTAACSAQRDPAPPAAWVCWGQNGKLYSWTATAWDASAFCSVGTANPLSPTFPTAWQVTQWICNWRNNWANSPTCSASKQSLPPWDWTCGWQHNLTYSWQATSFTGNNFCGTWLANPTSPAFPALGSSTAWSCAWWNSWANANCTVAREKEPFCGSANWQTFSNAPTANLCTDWTASTVITNTSSYTWTCKWISSWIWKSCSANRPSSPPPTPANGSCWTANWQTLTSAPTTNLCGDNSSPAVTDNGTTFTWSCAGTNGGSSSSCSANRPISAICWMAAREAQGWNPNANHPTFPTSNLCAVGSVILSWENHVSFSWYCGQDQTVRCTALRTPFCWPENGKTYLASQTAFNEPEDHNTSPYPQDWPATPFCTIWAPVLQIWWVWAFPSFPAQWQTSTWYCVNNWAVSSQCSVSRSLPPEPGQCWWAAKTYTANETAFAGNLCTVGIANPVSPDFPTQWGSTTWTCDWRNGGTPATCTATKETASVPSCPQGQRMEAIYCTGACYADQYPHSGNGCEIHGYNCVERAKCWSSNNQTFTQTPTNNLCEKWTASSITMNGNTATWTCSEEGETIPVACRTDSTTQLPWTSVSCNATVNTPPAQVTMCDLSPTTVNQMQGGIVTSINSTFTVNYPLTLKFLVWANYAPDDNAPASTTATPSLKRSDGSTVKDQNFTLIRHDPESESQTATWTVDLTPGTYTFYAPQRRVCDSDHPDDGCWTVSTYYQCLNN